jgi:hypothetical protein
VRRPDEELLVLVSGFVVVAAFCLGWWLRALVG